MVDASPWKSPAAAAGACIKTTTMRTPAPARRRANIQVIPLIDIIFFLLATFIMVSLSMTKNEGVNVALPGAASSQKQDNKEEAVTISVTEKGDVFYNKEKVTMAQLPFKLQSYKTSTKNPRVVVNGDANADFKMIVQAIDEVRKIGVTQIAISTQQK